MNNERASTKGAKRKRQQTPGTGSVPPRPQPGRAWLPRWAVLILCLLLSGGATWAVFEFVVWNRLPAALVGKWEVSGGPQDGAIFDFYRGGTLEARFNNNGMVQHLLGQVEIRDHKLLITTQNPKTNRAETRAGILRELSRTTLVVEFDTGEVYKMMRIP